MNVLAHEKASLQLLITELIDADEVVATVAVMHRIAEKMAYRALKREDSVACQKWLKLESALDQLLGMNKS